MTTSIEMLLDQIEDGDWDESLVKIIHACSGRRSRLTGRLGLPKEDRPGLFRKDAPETSKKAALTIKTGDARYRVLEHIVEQNSTVGCTREEIGEHLGMNDNTVRPRVRELFQMGLVRNASLQDGSPYTRPTRSGAQADVLCPTAQGQVAYAEASR